MILEIDAGNTRLKWRLLNKDFRFRAAGVCPRHEQQSMFQQIGEYEAVSAIYIASVSGDSENKILADSLFSAFGVYPTFAESSPTSSGVINGYEKANDLGVDRWLAMLAAFNSDDSAVCVIDCGTALTIDFVDHGGIHLGGYILPGLTMLKSALLTNTAKISSAYQHDVDFNSIKAGNSTNQCIDRGRLMMSVASIEKAILENAAERSNVYLTGGDAAVLLDYLPPLFNAVLWPDLVLDGLGVIFGYRPK